MSERFDSKPEPIPTKLKWHYDSYYLSQLERLNIRTPSPKGSKIEKIAQQTSEIKSSTEKMVVSVSQESELQISKRNEVIKRIYELAASIGVSVTIIENPKLAA